MLLVVKVANATQGGTTANPISRRLVEPSPDVSLVYFLLMLLSGVGK